MRSEDKAIWTQKNGTMSDKSAREEFGLTQEEIIRGIRAGKLQYRENNMHGNPYFKLIRSEVEDLVTKKYGENYVKTKALEKELKEVARELHAAKRRISILDKRKIELLSVLGENAFEKRKKI